MGYIGTKPSAVPLTSADITDGIITSAKIADGTIVNADINASAGVVFTKLASTGTLTVDNIQFPATQVASANANNLDDYEEGTFTPAWQQTTSGPTATYSTQLGRYTRIGNLVYVTIRLDNATFTAGVGDLRISGLPFTVANDSTFPAASLGFKTSFTTNGPDYGRFINNSTVLELYIDDNINEIILSSNNVGASSTIIMSGCYRV